MNFYAEISSFNNKNIQSWAVTSQLIFSFNQIHVFMKISR